jgi:hypothetical protein
MRKLASVTVFVLSIFASSPSRAQDQGQNVRPGVAGLEYPCSGGVKRLPADLLGREYRGQCVEGIEVWSWALRKLACQTAYFRCLFALKMTPAPEQGRQ